MNIAFLIPDDKHFSLNMFGALNALFLVQKNALSTCVSGLATSPGEGSCLELGTWGFVQKPQKAQHLGGSRPCSRVQPLGFPRDSFYISALGEKDPFPLPVF